MDKEGGEKKVQRTYFDVLGLCCSSEVPLIEKILGSLDGVEDFSVIVPTKTVIVVHDSLLISQTQILTELNRARLEANIRARGSTTYKNKWPSPYAAASGLLLVLSLLKYAYSPFQWLAVGAIAAGIPPVVIKAVAAARSLRLDINILVLITVSGSIALHDYWEAGTIVFLFTISDWLESRASHKATAVMSSLVNMVPQRAVLAETGEEVNADEIGVNSIVAVKAGEVIPIDGVVVEGNCEVDEKILTGESFPVAKQKGSTVWASTVNLNGYVNIRTTAVAQDRVVARMVKIVEEAQDKKSPTQRLMDKCANYYTPAIVVISGTIAVVPLAFHVRNMDQWFHLALVILVSGCPCALLLSTPVAVFCGLSQAATLGILFKGAEHLETLAWIKIMAFDKTGTITRGEFIVADFEPLRDDISSNLLLHWTSSIESKSCHPIADALVEYARVCAVEIRPDKVDNFQNFPGEGICGKIEDNVIYIGNSKIALRAGCAAFPRLQDYDVEGKSVGYIFLGASPVGVFCLTDICRTGAKEAIEELKMLGMKTAMLTGDCLGAAKRTQEQLGGALDFLHAELLPQDKVSIIEALQRDSGATAMIGDGLNDAPALATADVGIAMGISGTALARESGDIILMSNDIQRIAKAYCIARRVKWKIIQNMVISISTKAAVVGLAVAGHPLIWAAVLADVGTCLLVIFNSMLLLRGTNKRAKPSCQSHKSCSDIESNQNCHGSSSGCCGGEKYQGENLCCCQHKKGTVSFNKCCQKVVQNSERETTESRGCSKTAMCSEKTRVHRNLSAKKCQQHEHDTNCKSSLQESMSLKHCNSSRRECCSRNGHMGMNLKGGLPEIDIE